MSKKFIFNQILLITTSFLAFGMEDPNPKHSNAKRKKAEPTTINNLGFKKLKIDEEEQEPEEHNIDKIITQISSEKEGSDERSFQDHSESENSSIILIKQLSPHLMPLLLNFVQQLSILDKFSNQKSGQMLDSSTDKIQSLANSFLCCDHIKRLPPELTRVILKFVIYQKAKNLCKKIISLKVDDHTSDEYINKINYKVDKVKDELESCIETFGHITAFKNILPDWRRISEKLIIKSLKKIFQHPLSPGQRNLFRDIFLETDSNSYFLFMGCISAHKKDFTEFKGEPKIKGITQKFNNGPYLIDFALDEDFKRLVKLLIERKALQILVDQGLTLFDVFGISDPSMCRHPKLIQKISDEFKKSNAKSKTNYLSFSANFKLKPQ